MHEPITGATYLLRGLRLLGASGIKRFVAIPLTVNAIVFTLLLWLAVEQAGSLIDQLMPELPGWLAWLSWLFWIFFAIAAVAIIFFTFTLVANVIAAPFNGLLAEAVERHLTGRPLPDSGGLLAAFRSAPAQMVDELRKLGYYAKWAIPILILFLIPVLNLLAPFLWALFGAWMLAVQYADYPLGNHGLLSVDQRRVLGQQKFLTLGFGGATMVATMFPVANLLVMPAAVAGATAMVVERFRPQLEGKGAPT